MSDLAALQGQMGSYASSFADGQQTVSNYISNYDTNAFNTWQDTAAGVRQQGATISSIGGGVLGIQIAGKAAYKKYYGEGSTKSGGAEGGEAGNSNAGAGGAADATADTAADTGGLQSVALDGSTAEVDAAVARSVARSVASRAARATTRAARAAENAGSSAPDEGASATADVSAGPTGGSTAAAPAASTDAAAAPAASTDAAADTEAAGGEVSTETDAAYATSFDFGDAVTGSAASAVVDAATTTAAAGGVGKKIVVVAFIYIMGVSTFGKSPDFRPKPLSPRSGAHISAFRRAKCPGFREHVT